MGFTTSCFSALIRRGPIRISNLANKLGLWKYKREFKQHPNTGHYSMTQKYQYLYGLSFFVDRKWEFKERPRDFGGWPYLFDSFEESCNDFLRSQLPLFILQFAL